MGNPRNPNSFVDPAQQSQAIEEILRQLGPDGLKALSESQQIPQQIKDLAAREAEARSLRQQPDAPQGHTVRNGIFVASSPLEGIAAAGRQAVGVASGIRHKHEAKELGEKDAAGRTQYLQALVRALQGQGQGAAPSGPPPAGLPPPPPQGTPPPPPGSGQGNFVDRMEGNQAVTLGPGGAEQSSPAGVGQEGDVMGADGQPDPAARAQAEARVQGLKSQLGAQPMDDMSLEQGPGELPKNFGKSDLDKLQMLIKALRGGG